MSKKSRSRKHLQTKSKTAKEYKRDTQPFFNEPATIENYSMLGEADDIQYSLMGEDEDITSNLATPSFL